jgi:hypothetical protein
LYKDTILEVTDKYYHIIQHLTTLRKTSKDYFPARMTSQKYVHHPLLELYNSCISALSLKEQEELNDISTDKTLRAKYILKILISRVATLNVKSSLKMFRAIVPLTGTKILKSVLVYPTTKTKLIN